MKKQAADYMTIWRGFPIDPLATMALRLAQMRRTLDLSFHLRSKSAADVLTVRQQVQGLRQMVTAGGATPLLFVLLVILDRIDAALESEKMEFAQQAIVHLEKALLRAS